MATFMPSTRQGNGGDPVRWLLRAEGGVLALAGLWCFAQSETGWGTFALCLLLPDLAMLGYLAGPRVGALTYNMAHTWIAPLLLLALTQVTGQGWGLAAASIWAVHIGADRAMGYGLKHASSFQHTHLGRLNTA